MPAKIMVYTLEARTRSETPYPYSDWESQDYQEAVGVAEREKLQVIENTFTWADSEMVNDFTEDPDDPNPDE